MTCTLCERDAKVYPSEEAGFTLYVCPECTTFEIGLDFAAEIEARSRGYFWDTFALLSAASKRINASRGILIVATTDDAVNIANEQRAFIVREKKSAAKAA